MLISPILVLRYYKPPPNGAYKPTYRHTYLVIWRQPCPCSNLDWGLNATSYSLSTRGLAYDWYSPPLVPMTNICAVRIPWTSFSFNSTLFVSHLSDDTISRQITYALPDMRIGNRISCHIVMNIWIRIANHERSYVRVLLLPGYFLLLKPCCEMIDVGTSWLCLILSYLWRLLVQSHSIPIRQINPTDFESGTLLSPARKTTFVAGSRKPSPATVYECIRRTLQLVSHIEQPMNIHILLYQSNRIRALFWLVSLYHSYATPYIPGPNIHRLSCLWRIYSLINWLPVAIPFRRYLRANTIYFCIIAHQELSSRSFRNIGCHSNIQFNKIAKTTKLRSLQKARFSPNSLFVLVR